MIGVRFKSRWDVGWIGHCLLISISCLFVQALSENQTDVSNGKQLLDRLLRNYGASSLRPVRNTSTAMTLQLRFLPNQLIHFAVFDVTTGRNGRVHMLLVGLLFGFFSIIVISLVDNILCMFASKQQFSRNLTRGRLLHATIGYAAGYRTDPSPMGNNERQQMVTVGSAMAQYWTDELMTWDPEVEGVDKLAVDINEIWTPDLIIIENVDREFIRHEEFPVLILPNGYITWYTPMITTTTCRVRVRYFPFDTQVCNITFGSSGHSMEELDLTFKNDSEANHYIFLLNGVWELVNVGRSREEMHYLCCPNPYPLITYTIHLQRLSTFYVNTILVPCVLLSFMNLLVFWLPPDAGEKISLGMTNLLALILFQQLVAENMPPLGDEFPILGTFFATMIAVGCVAVTGTVIILRIFFKGPGKPLPRFIRGLLRKKFVKHTLNRYTTNNSRRHRVHSRMALDGLHKSVQLRYDRGSGAVDTDVPVEELSPSKDSEKQPEQLRDIPRDVPRTIMQELAKSEERAFEIEKRGAIEQEWKDLAIILDFLLFLLLLLVTVGSLAILLISYGTHRNESEL